MAVRVDLPVEELARRYAAGAPLRELADHYGISTGTVRTRLKAAGVELRRRGAPRREVDLGELVYETHLAGSVRAAARRPPPRRRPRHGPPTPARAAPVPPGATYEQPLNVGK